MANAERDSSANLVDNIHKTGETRARGVRNADCRPGRQTRQPGSAALAPIERTGEAPPGDRRGSLEAGRAAAGAYPLRALRNLALAAARSISCARLRGITGSDAESWCGRVGTDAQGCAG